MALLYFADGEIQMELFKRSTELENNFGADISDDDSDFIKTQKPLDKEESERSEEAASNLPDSCQMVYCNSSTSTNDIVIHLPSPRGAQNVKTPNDVQEILTTLISFH